MRVGFIGLGRMGGAMTRRLLEGGHEVGVYNRTAAKTKPLIDAGARVTASVIAVCARGLRTSADSLTTERFMLRAASVCAVVS